MKALDGLTSSGIFRFLFVCLLIFFPPLRSSFLCSHGTSIQDNSDRFNESEIQNDSLFYLIYIKSVFLSFRFGF